MIGCLTAPFKLLAFLLFIAALVLGFLYRDRLGEWGRSAWRDFRNEPAPVAVVGVPSAEALASARSKIGELGDADSVVLGADEVASLLRAGLDPYTRGTMDSLEVRLKEGSISATATVQTSRLPGGLLGPLGMALHDYEPITAEGSLEVGAPGEGQWLIDRISFRDIPLPRDAVPAIMQRVSGDSTRSVPVDLPDDVRGIRLRADGVTLYGNSR
jgi:hypothetical protein